MSRNVGFGRTPTDRLPRRTRLINRIAVVRGTRRLRQQRALRLTPANMCQKYPLLAIVKLMFATPTKADLDRNLSSILHDAHQKARAEKIRLTSEFAGRGLVSSGALISTVAGVLDGLHKEALERASPMLRDFADRMQITLAQIAVIARPHLQNMGNSVLGELPPAGLPAVHQQICRKYQAIFDQRLERTLRDFEIGFSGGRSQVRPPVTPPTQASVLDQSPMTNSELRGRLLSHFYSLRHSNGGYVPVTGIILSPEPVSDDAVAGVCRQLADDGLIEWTAYLQGPTIGSARITGPGVDAVERGGSANLEIQFPSKYASAPSSLPMTSDAPMSEAALTEICEVVSTIKADLPALALSNSAKADITADISQIKIETERPTPRKRFMQLYLESLRDNLAKAAGAAAAGGLVTLAALVTGLLAKHFGIF